MAEASFIAAPSHSKFISDWRKEYESCILSSDPSSYYKNNDTLKLEDFKLNIPYHLSYMSCQIVMRRHQNYRLTLRNAEGDFFLYSLLKTRKWNVSATADILLSNKISKAPPFVVKLISYDRKWLDFLMKEDFYKKHSWLGGLYYKYKSKL